MKNKLKNVVWKRVMVFATIILFIAGALTPVVKKADAEDDGDWAWSSGSGTTGELYRTGDVSIGTSTSTHKLVVESSDNETVRLIGNGNLGSWATLNFGDGDYVYLKEYEDDRLRIQARLGIAMGYYTNASGQVSTAIGYYTNASGYASTAIGYYTTASGYYSTAIGYGTTASGWYGSTAMGYFTTASGYYSTAMGREIEASGNYSIAIALNDQNGAVVSKDNTMAIMGGNVGIGTVSPDVNYSMEIQGNPKGLYVKTADNTYQSIVGQCHHQYRPAGFVLENRYPASANFPKGVMMRFKGMDTNGVMQEYLAFIAEYVTRTAGAIDGDCWIRPVKNGGANWAFRFTHDGKLLIKDGGSASDVPESALHVVGAINLDPIPAPGAPTTGFIIYCDQADGDLKAKSDTGIVTTIASD